MPQACIAERFPAYQPAMRIITAISQTNPAVITTSFDHQYIDGLIVRLYIPLANGMQQISGNYCNNSLKPTTYEVTVTGLGTFSIPVDATSFEAFVNNECSSVVPVAEINSQLTNATRNVLPY